MPTDSKTKAPIHRAPRIFSDAVVRYRREHGEHNPARFLMSMASSATAAGHA